MENRDFRKYTVLSFFLFAGLIGFIADKFFTTILDWLKLGGNNLIAGLSSSMVVLVAAILVGVAVFFGLTFNAKAANFIDDVFAELFKTTWPNVQETTRSTIAVSVMVTVAALMFFFIDAIWMAIFRFIL